MQQALLVHSSRIIPHSAITSFLLFSLNFIWHLEQGTIIHSHRRLWAEYSGGRGVWNETTPLYDFMSAKRINSGGMSPPPACMHSSTMKIWSFYCIEVLKKNPNHTPLVSLIFDSINPLFYFQRNKQKGKRWTRCIAGKYLEPWVTLNLALVIQ